MIQEIIVAVIIFAALFWASKMTINRIKNKEKNKCNGCSSDCSSCGIDPKFKKEIKEAFEKKQNNKK